MLFEWASAGEDVGGDLDAGLDELQQEVEAAETKKMLGGEHDRANAIVTIHPGAGGTESQDWAEMLLRMYLKWSERRGFKREIIDYQPGDEAGIKSVTFTLTGDYAFGLMSAEAGVHRLVRISPFDQAARRHTSFASVFVWPELPEDVDIEIDEKDLRIDTYRSSGAGGQHVNVTDSAVRITHLPTGIVVSCQNERSQHKNRASAMKVLKARLFDLKLKEQQAKLEQIARREEGDRLRQPDPQLRAAAVPDDQGPPDEGGGRRRQPRARRRPRPVHQDLSDAEGERHARRAGGGRRGLALAYTPQPEVQICGSLRRRSRRYSSSKWWGPPSRRRPRTGPVTDEETLRHFQALIRFDTSDPPGNEKPAADYLRQVLEKEGIPVQTFALEPNRPNLVARLKGTGASGRCS